MAKCAGCLKDHTEFFCYDEEGNSVTNDGSYANGLFVCDYCYVKLDQIDHKLSVGGPEILQFNASKYIMQRSQKNLPN